MAATYRIKDRPDDAPVIVVRTSHHISRTTGEPFTLAEVRPVKGRKTSWVYMSELEASGADA